MLSRGTETSCTPLLVLLPAQPNTTFAFPSLCSSAGSAPFLCHDSSQILPKELQPNSSCSVIYRGDFSFRSLIHCTYSINIFLLFLQFSKTLLNLPPIPPTQCPPAQLLLPFPVCSQKNQSTRPKASQLFRGSLVSLHGNYSSPAFTKSFTQPSCLSLPSQVYTNSRHVTASPSGLDKLLGGERTLV